MASSRRPLAVALEKLRDRLLNRGVPCLEAELDPQGIEAPGLLRVEPGGKGKGGGHFATTGTLWLGARPVEFWHGLECTIGIGLRGKAPLTMRFPYACFLPLTVSTIGISLAHEHDPTDRAEGGDDANQPDEAGR